MNRHMKAPQLVRIVGAWGKGRTRECIASLLLSLSSCNNPLTDSEEPSPQRLDTEEDGIAIGRLDVFSCCFNFFHYKNYRFLIRLSLIG